MKKFEIDSSLFRFLAVSIIFIFYSRSFLSIISSNFGSSFLTLIWVFLCFLVLISLKYPIKVSYTLFLHHLILVFFICVLTIFWSVEKISTIKSSFQLIVSAGFGVLAAQYFDFPSFLKFLILGILFLFGLGLYFFVIEPDLTLMSGTYEGVYSGVFIHKNYLSRVSIVGTIACLVAIRYKLFSNYKLYIALLAMVISLMVSGSAGGKVLLVVLLYVFLVVEFVYVKVAYRKVFGFVVLSLPIILFLGFSDLIFSVLGKTSTLTGRIPLWIVVTNQIVERPFLGYGYNAFWDSSTYSARIDDIFGWDAPNAHNGYLEVLLGIGLLGLILFLVGFIKILMVSIKRHFSKRNPETLFAIMFLIFSFFANLLYSQILIKNDIMWVLYVYVCLIYNGYYKKTSNRLEMLRY